MKPTICFISLGCAKNLVNSEQMMYLTEQAGYTVTGEPEGASAVVLNTCGFIDSAKSEAIDHILRLGELKREGRIGKILVAGCLAERYRQEILEELPEADGLLGCGSFHEVVSGIEAALRGETPCLFGDVDAPEAEIPRIQATPWYTAYLKIAEGCDNRCAYCVIPSLRGRYRSRSMEEIVREAEELARRGVRELIVVAQDITRYGTDRYGKRMLPELLRFLCRIEDFRWIRLHYLYPDEIDGELIRTIAREDKILKYLDIPIQHVNDEILRRMNRRGTKEEITALFRRLREEISDLVLRTSIICGLPGEGEAEFEELCDFLREAKIERAGIFPFSPEEGTAACDMPDQADRETAERRRMLLTELQSEIMDRFNEGLRGRLLTVLCEGIDEETGLFQGRSWAESPDVDGRILFTADRTVSPGEMVPVRILGAEDGTNVGRLEENDDKEDDD
ncbi:30S ribosomal protein S12 methylthiotransferase RimO [Papillibacter cinnamivorans]|uniref:Ribosomal protein uS12 methylthiotransferase RimO n=1 Tax=Papillibacter cinnamivorans DSM 12816 TaxID=1122930 RepID=A0A1W1ZJ17_9FIRM|nr:30S ribosomal protein S12 methylthiotransferase RimO [Papillibacter cinnamivorans]SMC48202.1 ribosomal protein S12 methylthiotransferase [Papillibacter cinnamivorans DSM 12816]